jgi:drug/metabolite transporter (DMT)-like permease
VTVSRLDLLLLLMVFIWGSNFSLIKDALRDFPELSFNALRLTLASAVFLVAIAASRQRTTFSAAEWRRVALLGVIGHLLYQLCFLAGVARTSVANSALIFGCTPVAVALLAAAFGHERLTRPRLVGAALSFAGIYAVVGHGAALSTATLLGDALVCAGMVCWSLYSVLAQPMLRRHSPLVVTGWSIAIGSCAYVVVALPSLARTEWATISPRSWLLMSASSLLALAFAYMIWYTAVQRIGSSRTAIYSNLTPIAAMVVAAVWLGERITGVQVVGAALIFSGLAVSRTR